MDYNELIKKITPPYNCYKENKDRLSGVESLEIMWNIGDELKNFIDINKIPPHTLYREIYGKSEGRKNIAQRSYITREFQGRCYRIRNIFKKKDQIKRDLSGLKNFTSFREAMPFFDNPKYILKGSDRENILNLLNSNVPANIILERIKLLQKEKIGIKNPRTQKLSELEKEKNTFISFYNFIYNLLKEGSYSNTIHNLGNINIDFIKILSKNTSVLSQEGLKNFDFKIPNDIQINWKEYGELVKMLTEQRDAKIRRRFRRIISPERIVRLSDMLYALTSETDYNKFK